MRNDIFLGTAKDNIGLQLYNRPYTFLSLSTPRDLEFPIINTISHLLHQRAPIIEGF